MYNENRMNAALPRMALRLAKRAALRLLPAVAGFALARTGILGRTGVMEPIYPFGAAFAAAAPSGSVAAAMAGILLGFLLPGSDAETLRCAAAALAVAGIKWALSELKIIRSNPFFAPAAAFAGVVLTGMVVTSSIGAAVSYDLAAYIAEGAMAAAGAYFFSVTAEIWRYRQSRRFSMQEVCCAAASLCIICIPLCRLNIFGLSPVSAALMVLALAAAFRMGASGGSVVGIALGTVLALADGRFALLGVMAVAVLVCSLFSPLGSVAVSAAFCISLSLGVLASGEVDVLLIIEAVAASVAFPIIGPHRLAFIFDALEPRYPGRTALGSDSRMAQRLTNAADGLESAVQTVSLVAEQLEKMDTPKANVVCRQATESVCADCAISRFCWESAREQTQHMFDGFSEILRREGSLNNGNVGQQLRDRCARWGEMSQRINALYAEFSANQNARRRVCQMRQAAAGQLRGCGRLLAELAKESDREDKAGEMLSLRAADALNSGGMNAEDVCCVRQSDGSVTVNMILHENDEHPEPEFSAADILSEELEVSFAQPVAVREGEALFVRLESCPAYSLSVGVAQHSRCGGRLCGDVFRMDDQGRGRKIVMLSDGMGSGGRAAVDAAMTCDLMHRLLDAGFGEAGAMELVNSALQMVSGDESLATLDFAGINMYTGEVKLIKAGAASSYILKKEKAEKISMESLPLGIMQQADSADMSFILEPGDIVVMVSDGAAGQNDDWLLEELKRCETDDMKRLARDILALAAAQNTDGEDDDITVAAMRLEKSADCGAVAAA